MSQAAFTQVMLQFVQHSPNGKAALFNVPFRLNGDMTVWVPYSQMDNPEVLDESKLGKDRYVRIKIQTWLCARLNLLKE